MGSLFGKRGRAWLALLAFSGSFGLPFADTHRFGADDDAACGRVAFASGQTSVQIEPVVPAAAPEHCPFCHFERAFGGAKLTAVVALPRPVNMFVGTFTATRSLRETTIVERPSRAPPSVVL